MKNPSPLLLTFLFAFLFPLNATENPPCKSLLGTSLLQALTAQGIEPPHPSFRVRLQAIKSAGDSAKIERALLEPAMNSFFTRLPTPQEIDQLAHGYLVGTAEPFSYPLTQSRFGVYFNNELIGIARANYFYNQRMADFAYAIFPAYHGHGFATEAVASLIHFFSTHFNMAKFRALIHESNKASQQVVQKLEFTKGEAVKGDPEFAGFHYYNRLVRTLP